MQKYKMLILLSGVCASCTVGPDYKQPQTFSDLQIKKELQLNKEYRVPQNWYEQFKDEQLNNLISLGLQNNTDIKLAILHLREARINLDIADKDFLPIINAQTGWNYEKNSKNIGISYNSHYYSAGFDASWELDLWGKGRRQNEANYAEMLAKVYTLDNIKTVIIAEIADDYINLLKNTAQIRLTEQNIKLQQEIFKQAESKYRSGLTDDTAYNQAKYLLETTTAQLAQYQNNAESYKNALSILVGVLPSELPIDSDKKSNLFNMNYKYDMQMVYNLPIKTIRNRPDVKASEQNLVAQNALVGKAVAELYPSVSVSALWGYSAQGGNSLFNSKSQGYSYSPSASLPLLDWNKLQNNVKLQKYIKEESIENYKNTVLSAISEIKDAMIVLQNDYKKQQNLDASVRDMQKTVSNMQKKYSNGLINFSELLSAEQNLISAQNNSLSGKAEIFQDIVKYYKASGGGYLL